MHVLTVVWAVLGGLWLLSAPGFLVAFAAVGDPPRGYLPGWVVAFLGWASTPVTVILALVAGEDAGLRAWLPLASLAALPLGYLVMRLGILIARRPDP